MRRNRQALAVLVVATVAVMLVASCASPRRQGARSTTTAPSTSASTTTATTSQGPMVDANYDPYAGTAPAAEPKGRTSTAELRTADGRTRTYRLYVPSASGAAARMPLLIALHGGLGSAAQFEANSGFNGLAESNRFIAVYPDGIGAFPNGAGPRTWNGGYCCGPAARNNIDDVAFINQLVDTLEGQYAIDPERVYAAGHSNGGILAYRLACELSTRIVAVGVQAGSLGVMPCNLEKPVSLFHLHGTADQNHPINGGKGNGLAGVEFRSARSSVDDVVVADGCTSTPSTATDLSNADVTATTWSQCDGGAVVRYVMVEGATHAWMGHAGVSNAAESFVGTPYPELDASRAIWSFLTSQSRR